jgi:hypothetical protein
MIRLKMEDIIETGGGRMKREEHDTEHLRERRTFRLPRYNEQKHLSQLLQHAKAWDGIETREAQLFSGCITMVLKKRSHPSRQESPRHSWKCKGGCSIPKKTVLVCGGGEKLWLAGWDLIWSPCSTDWTWRYMWFGQDRGERRTGLTSHPEREPESARYSSRNPEDVFHNHMAARSHQWMVVIMDYDMPQHGRFNQDRRREDQARRTRHTAPSQKKNVHTTKKPPAEASLTSSTTCQGIRWNGNERSTIPLRLYYYDPYETQSFVTSRIFLPLLKCKAACSVLKKPVNIILRRGSHTKLNENIAQ